MSNAQKDTPLREFKFGVKNEGAVGLNKLCTQLAYVVPADTKIEPNVPLSLTVVYCLNAIACAPRRFKKRLWHLKAPNAGTVLNAVQSVLEQSEFCNTNQIVTAIATKGPANFNELAVEVRELDAPCYEDRPYIEQRVLEYYIELCTSRGKTPSYKAYNNLLKKLKHKNKNSSSKVGNALADVVKAHGKDVDFSKE
jgi:hypothetical protein